MPILFGSLILVLILATIVWRSDFLNSLANRLSSPKSRTSEKLCKETEHALHGIDVKIQENDRKKEELEKANQDLQDFKEGVLISHTEDEVVVEVVEKKEVMLFDKTSDDETSK